MDRKSRIWIWVLSLLLVAALVTSVMFKLRLDDAQSELASVKAMRDKAIAEQLDAQEALEQALAQNGLLEAELETVRAELAGALTTPEPTAEPTVAPTAEPTAEPTVVLTSVPTVAATEEPVVLTEAEQAAAELLDVVYADRVEIHSAIERLRGAEETAGADAYQAQMDEAYAAFAAVEAEISEVGSDAALTDAEKVGKLSEYAPKAEEARAALDDAYHALLTELIEKGDEQAKLDIDAVELRILKRELKKLEAERDDYVAQLEAAKGENEALEAELAEQIAQKDAEIAEKEAEILDLEAKLEEASVTIDALTTEGATKDGTIQELQGMLDQADADAAALTGQLTATQDDVARLEGELATAREALSVRDAELKAAQDAIAALEGDVAAGKSDNAALQAELVLARSEAAALTEELNTAKSDIATLEDALSSAYARVAATEEELAGVNATLSEVRTELANAQNALTGTQDELTGTKTALADTQTELSDTKSTLEATQAELADTLSELVSTRADLTKTRSELEAYRMRYAVGEGEGHASADMGGRVIVDKDGVTAQFDLINNTLSGNTVVVELAMDGNVIYTSPKIKPGEALGAFTLKEPLAVGVYEGMVSIRTLNTSGEEASVIRIAVEIAVGE